VLRSLQTGNLDYVLGRKTVGTSASASVDLLFDQGNKRLGDAGWSAQEHSLSIFDQTYVAENIYLGDSVELENRRNLYRVIIGRDGVHLAEEEKSLTEQGRQVQNQITETERAIKAVLPQGHTFTTFSTLEILHQAEEKIRAQESRVAAVRDAAAIQARPALSPCKIADLDVDVESVLGETLDDVGHTAEQMLVRHLDRHRMREGGQDWLDKGLHYIASDECPFCARGGIEAIEIVKTFRAIFSDDFRQLKARIEVAAGSIREAVGANARARVQTIIAQNEVALSFWRQHCEIEAMPALDRAIEDLKRSEDLLSGLLAQKAGTPLERIKGSADLTTARTLMTRAKDEIDRYDRSVGQANQLVDRVKKAAAAGSTIEAETALAVLKARKRRHDADVVALFHQHRKLRETKRLIEEQKSQVRQKLEEHSRRVFQSYESRLNHYLDRFNAGFSVTRTTYAYPAGVAASTYQLMIEGHHVDLGDSRTPLSQPSFKNTLSAGDRTTLGLAFFLATVEREPDLPERIVVFDDPFGSHDAFRRRQTLYEILGVGERAKQVIVLSHDVQFLKQLWEKSAHNARSTAQIFYSRGAGSKFTEFDLEQAARGRVAAELDDLFAFRANGAGNPREIIKKLRIVLETQLRGTYPTSFPPSDNLGTMLQKIRTAGAAHPAHALYAELDQINEYTADYHHGEDPLGAPEPSLDASELQGFVRTTLQIVNAIPA
jgi:wobble nucleotide-excising tRNase